MSEQPTSVRQSDRIRERTLLLEIRRQAEAEALAEQRETQRLQRELRLKNSQKDQAQFQDHSAYNKFDLPEAVKTRIVTTPRPSKIRRAYAANAGISNENLKAKVLPSALLAGIKRKGTSEVTSSDDDAEQSEDDYSESTLTPRKRVKAKSTFTTPSKAKSKRNTGSVPPKTKSKSDNRSVSRRKLILCRAQSARLKDTMFNPERAQALDEVELPDRNILQLGVTNEEWIQYTISSMLQGFNHAKEHHNTPLSAIIYWMPRIQTQESAAAYMSHASGTSESFPNFWTVPLKALGEPWEIAPTLQHLRTDQVAHWLHISMQDLVGFLSLCTVKEVTALNAYLYFRVELVKVIRAIPCASQWLYSGVDPPPGGHVYDLLLKFRSLDDEQQRLLSWTLHAFIRQRRDANNLAILPRNAPYRFNDRNYRALFEYLHKAWSMHRTKTSPLLEWTARSLFPDWIDSRSINRWHMIETPDLDTITMDQIHSVLEADMRFLVRVETDRTLYMLGDMALDEVRIAVADHREQKSPFSHLYGNNPRLFPYDYRTMNDNSNAWWIQELVSILTWHRQFMDLTGTLTDPSTLMAQSMILKQYIDILQVHHQLIQKDLLPFQSPSPTATVSSVGGGDSYLPADAYF
ncbi:hypothetical protein BGX28_000273 [Mortierella sp. GBA30]|nr:hypothetical protein BGX28_000273 [Mortierella sp. GBA30]